VTSHPLAGEFSVDASARLLRHYRYAEERMMRIMGGWIALTPELPAKLVFGRHVWECAQHADLWGRRLPELRAPAQQSEPPNDAFVRFMDLLEHPEEPGQTGERLAGIYRVLKPHLVASYERHLAVANPVYEPPTRRILDRVIAEERRHVAAGAVVLRHLGARPDEWTTRLGQALTEAGGVAGDGAVPALVTIDTTGIDPTGDVVALDSTFDGSHVEPDLRARVEAHCRALVAGDVAGIAADLAPDVRDAVLEQYARLPRGVATSEIVAYARLGAQRVVKAKLAGRGVAAVAVYSEADRDAPHVADADEAVLIGPSPARESYLNVAAILDAARRTNADAIHPGYGFLSENWRFAEACANAGLVFIGPSPEAIRQMGDKTEARRLMAAAGVPIVPGSEGPVGDVAAALATAERIGYPVMLKAAAGGGGIGMARASNAVELERFFAIASRRAQSAFGVGAVYVERYVEAPRHVEVQVFGDGKGEVVHLYERECSIQRRHQKLVEESPAPNLRDHTRRGLLEAALAGARAIRYGNAGTMEFLVDADGRFYFLEMNTRLQVEHPVTEEVTGTDLVVAQLQVAAGEGLPWRQDAIVQRGAAIEVRVYAEDPAKNFLPSPGTLTRLHVPTGDGIRIESGVAAGSVVTPHYDPLLMKVVASAGSREAAIARMAGALDDLAIEGVKTTVPILQRILAHPDFRRGAVHTQMVEQGAFNG
jgi:acetyl-CoA carboxylase biotin carboxylase subunit